MAVQPSHGGQNWSEPDGSGVSFAHGSDWLVTDSGTEYIPASAGTAGAKFVDVGSAGEFLVTAIGSVVPTDPELILKEFGSNTVQAIP